MKSIGKIGVFDSGFGGLTILKEIVKALPEYDYVYLGDSARAPYGSRSQETICEFTKEGVEFLFAKGAELVILACNSASSEALRKIQHEFLKGKYSSKKVLGVIFPAAEEAVLRTKNKRIGVLGTEATVSSHAFKRELQKLDSKIKVFEVPAPLLVPIVEAGEGGSESAKLLVKQYVLEALEHNIDTLILGCTHYEILEKDIKRNTKNVNIISEGKVVAKKLKDYLVRHTEIDSKLRKRKKIEFFTTDSKDKFDKLGSRFFGKRIRSLKTSILC
jgi:glutamate racemase